MLSDRESLFLSHLSAQNLHLYFKNIASFHRRSDGRGEGEARAYILEELDRLGIATSESASEGLLAFGSAGQIEILSPSSAKPAQGIQAKAWNFSAPAPPGTVSGAAVVLRREDFPSGVLDHLSDGADVQRDLEGRVVLSRYVSPQAVLNAQLRGAVGFVICWETGGEKQIHHSGVAMWWGTPMPEESRWAPAIPVMAVNRDDGDFLIGLAGRGDLLLSISCESVETAADVHLVEAVLPSTTGDPHFLLMGAHLDSKHLGATDNATGSAIALSLAEALGSIPERRWGVKICWWSGHEFGRYTGSSNYARDRFQELDRYCVAYSNLDMPGMRGAVDFGKITAGPDLFALAERTVADLTGQKGIAAPRVRAWDQSFQNLGISPFFIWTSLLPFDSPDRTGSSVMPWWWHTEADTVEFCDPQTLETDAQIYMTGVLRLLSEGKLDADSLGGAVILRLRELETSLSGSLDPRPLREALEDVMKRWGQETRPFEATLGMVRLLNRLYYSARDPYLQDWGDVGDFIPGMSEAARVLQRNDLSRRKRIIVHNYAKAQWNRLDLLIRQARALVSSSER
jgi:hypothetical protein